MILFTLCILAVSIPIVLAMIPRLPDHKTHADGGVGGAFNLVSVIATALWIPALTSVVGALIMRATIRAPESHDDE